VRLPLPSKTLIPATTRGIVKLVTPKAYSPLSVAFEHPKSSLAPAQAVPLSASSAIVAAKILLKLLMFALCLFDPAGLAERQSNPNLRKRAMRRR
jgi:hypothetical protein